MFLCLVKITARRVWRNSSAAACYRKHPQRPSAQAWCSIREWCGGCRPRLPASSRPTEADAASYAARPPGGSRLGRRAASALPRRQLEVGAKARRVVLVHVRRDAWRRLSQGLRHRRWRVLHFFLVGARAPRGREASCLTPTPYIDPTFGTALFPTPTLQPLMTRVLRWLSFETRPTAGGSPFGRLRCSSPSSQLPRLSTPLCGHSALVPWPTRPSSTQLGRRWPWLGQRRCMPPHVSGHRPLP